MKFAEAHKAQADKFAIVTFHTTGGNGEETLDFFKEKLAGLEASKWDNKKFPFPVLIDKSGATMKDWRIRGFPTAALIDPEGNLVRSGFFDLEAELEKRLKAAK